MLTFRCCFVKFLKVQGFFLKFPPIFCPNIYSTCSLFSRFVQVLHAHNSGLLWIIHGRFIAGFTRLGFTTGTPSGYDRGEVDRSLRFHPLFRRLQTLVVRCDHRQSTEAATSSLTSAQTDPYVDGSLFRSQG